MDDDERQLARQLFGSRRPDDQPDDDTPPPPDTTADALDPDGPGHDVGNFAPLEGRTPIRIGNLADHDERSFVRELFAW